MSTTDTFTSTGTWTCPLYVTSVWARCWGGGGSGGGITATPSTFLSGGGGAGGAFAEVLAITVVPGTVYAVTVAAIKTGATGSGSAGNDTWFLSSATVLAKGGPGGSSPAVDGASGLGGGGTTTGSIGDNKFAGGSGANGLSGNNSTFVGSGGGGAGSGAAGSPGSGTSGGGGGSASGGSGGNGRTTAGAGSAGSVYGGGGSGAMGTAASHSFAGGNGAAGRVELEYTPSFVPSGGGVRAVAKEFVDVTSAPAIIDQLTPVAGDVFLLTNNPVGTDPILGPFTTGLWSWSAAGSAMTLVSDADGTYRSVREGTSAGVIAYTSSSSLILGFTGPPGYYIDPTGSTRYLFIRGNSVGFLGVSPAVTSGGTWTVQHNLGTKYLLAQIAATATPFAYVTTWPIQRTDLNTLSVIVGSTIAAGDYEIMVRSIL